MNKKPPIEIQASKTTDCTSVGPFSHEKKALRQASRFCREKYGSKATPEQQDTVRVINSKTNEILI
jgi:hypothetical protein